MTLLARAVAVAAALFGALAAFTGAAFAADDDPLSRKIAIEQNFVVNSMHAHRHAHGLIGALDRRQRDAGPARAQNNRRDDHVQSVKATCRKEA